MGSKVCPKCGYEIKGLPNWRTGLSVRCPKCDPGAEQTQPRPQSQPKPRVLDVDLEPLQPVSAPRPQAETPPRHPIVPRDKSQRRQGPRMGRDIARARERQQRLLEETRRRSEQQAALLAQQEAERARLATIDTGMGQCPSCGGRNITTVRRSENNTSGQSIACCVGLFLLWPALLLLPFLKTRYTSRRCVLCGYEWPV